jgi:hypothetical protein
MASQEAIQNILKAEYSSTRWKAFLSELFANRNMFSSPTPIVGINTAIATQAFHIGSIALDENGISRNIAVYEVTLAQNVVLERNRVGLRNLLKQSWKEQDAAFIVYHKPGDKNWRFSYVSELKKFNEAGEYVANNTEPKRYTYVLGETESCRTASERFYALQQKASNATLDDVKEAFSVEKLSKTFFADYKVHYQDFVQYLTGKRLEKVAGKWEEVKKHDPSPQMTYIFHDDEKDVRDFCKKLLGRIVFLYFIQKKGWLGVPLAGDWGSGKPDFMSRLLANCANPAIFYSEYLSKLFFETLNQKRDNDLAEIVAGEPTKIPYLNGGLFEEDNPKHRDLVFETDLFKKLFDFFDQYNFTIYEDDPNDHTVAVDPEMLGHIFENLLEDNKDKGAFYTPKEIVHYMCQESLIEYLSTWFTGKNYQVTADNFVSFDNTTQTSFISANEGCTGQGMLEITQAMDSPSKVINRSLIENLLKKQLSDDDKLAVVEHADEFNEALDKVKICDPAIGSGAFPMGLLQEIFTAKQTIHTFVHGDLTTFEPANIKLNIIQNSIYGVDIERGAVDIARLRFWLSLVVDEPAPQALPNLDYKIVVGNSLISKLGDDVIEIDWDIKPNNHGLFGAEEAKNIQTVLKQLSSLQKDFFNPSARKKDHASHIRNLKIELLINQLNLMIETKGLKHPPRKMATQSQKDFAAQTERYLQTQGWLAQISKLQTFKTQTDKTLEFFDWQLNFAEVMNKDVAESGKVGFDIVIGNPPYVQVKKGIFSESKFPYSEGKDKGKQNLYKVFTEQSFNIVKDGGIASMIVQSSLMADISAQFTRELLLTRTKIRFFLEFPKKSINADGQVFENVLQGTCVYFFRKTLPDEETSFMVSINNDVTTINNLISDRLNQRELIKIYPNGYFIPLVKPKEFSLTQKIFNQSKPLSEYILGSKKGDISSDTDKKLFFEKTHGYKLIRGNNVQRFSCKQEFDFVEANEKTKLIQKMNSEHSIIAFQNITGTVDLHRIHSCLFEKKDDLIFLDTTIKIYIYENINPKFLLACINSSYMDWYFRKTSTNNHVNGYEIEALPIPNITEAQHLRFIKLVDNIFNYKKTDESTVALEQQIDNMVYKLYSLYFDEVKLIDPEFPLTEAEYNLVTVE